MIKPDFKKMKLIPAIVQDYITKEVLMLAYVNEESYDYMIKNNRTCFFSRSRNELWIKGETSGNSQKIKGMYLDCDKDAILIYVEQIGNACHTGNRTCFFNEVVMLQDIEKNILDTIYETIKDRDENPLENSYTNYLLNEGIDKICKKVGEESTEVVIASKNENKDELIGEISDLIYHILVLMYNRNVKIDDIRQKLISRHGKICNKKVFRSRGIY